MTPESQSDVLSCGECEAKVVASRIGGTDPPLADSAKSVAVPGTLPADSNQEVMPHTTGSALKVAGEMVEEVSKGLKTVVSEAVAWAEEKVEKLNVKQEDGTGPYSSLATCAPSDLDVIATGILPAMPSDRSTKNDMLADANQDKAESKSGYTSAKKGN